MFNRNKRNSDRENFGDVCDNCPQRVNNNQADIDEDGVGNACDNCRFHKNPEQNPSDPVMYGTKCTTRCGSRHPGKANAICTGLSELLRSREDFSIEKKEKHEPF